MISFIALIYNLFHRKKENLLAISFIIVFYLFSGGWRVVTERYALPFYPFFAIISADFLLTVRERIKERKIKDIFLPCVITLFLITVLPSIVRMDRILAGKDTRIIAYEWLKDNIPRKSRILREPFTPEFGSTDDYRVKVDWQETIQQEDVERLALDYDYVLTANFDYDTASAFEGRLDKDAVLVREFSGERLGTFHNPRVRIYKLRGAKWENRKSW